MEEVRKEKRGRIDESKEQRAAEGAGRRRSRKDMHRQAGKTIFDGYVSSCDLSSLEMLKTHGDSRRGVTPYYSSYACTVLHNSDLDNVHRASA